MSLSSEVLHICSAAASLPSDVPSKFNTFHTAEQWAFQQRQVAPHWLSLCWFEENWLILADLHCAQEEPLDSHSGFRTLEIQQVQT